MSEFSFDKIETNEDHDIELANIAGKSVFGFINNKTLVKLEVRFNVRGNKFTAYESDALKYRDSVIAKSVSAPEPLLDEEGSFILDSDPRLFHIILDFLRTGILSFDELIDEQDIHKLISNLKALNLPCFRVNLSGNSWSNTELSPHLQLSVEDTTVTKISGDEDWNATVLGKYSVHSYKIRVDHDEIDEFWLIGFVPTTLKNYTHNSNNSETCGYYLFARNRSLYAPGVHNIPYCNKLIMKGTVITVNHDVIQRTISYDFDGENQGEAFRDLEDGIEFFPALCIHDQNIQLTFL